MYHYVIQIGYSVLIVWPQDPIHQPLKGGRGSMQTKWQLGVLEKSLTCSKGGFLPGSRGEWNLPVSLCEVEGCDEASHSQMVYQFIYQGHWVSVTLRHFI